MTTFEETAWNEATLAAEKAFDSCVPTPMVIGRSSGLFANDIIPGTEEVIEDGVCGFAWIRIKPARGPLVKWLKSQDKGSLGVYGGWRVSPYDFNPRLGYSQSMQRKEAAMKAACEVLKVYYPNSKIWVESRMD